MSNRRTSTALVAVATILALLAGFVAFAAWMPTASSVRADSLTSPEPTPSLDVTPLPIEPSESATEAPIDTSAIKNVVMVLADDLDWELFNQVPRLKALTTQGCTYTNHTVVDSLCCPSRVTILRGQYIHNHKVVSNIPETGGGFETFMQRREQIENLPTWLKRAGVRTAMYGKYLNGYPLKNNPTYIPPGWDDWGVPISYGASYAGYNYEFNDNGKIVKYGKKPKDFLNDVITNKATKFIYSASRTNQPFFVTLSTYAPHKPAPVAVRNKGTHQSTVSPRTPTYNATGVDEPAWMQKFKPRTQAQINNDDRRWRKRAQSAESVADSVVAILNTLRSTGRDKDTLLIVTSDNGYHIGHMRLPKGKRTPYAFDTVVPMVMIGPGITAGSEVNDMTSTIDLAPTITEIFGTQAPVWVDGRSLTHFIRTGKAPIDWRDAVLSESLGTSQPGDPDWQEGNPPQFNALRTKKWLYVEYKDGSRALYDREKDPYELVNIIRFADPALVAALAAQTAQLSRCAGPSCRVADLPTIPEFPDPTPSATPSATPSMTPEPAPSASPSPTDSASPSPSN